MLKCFLLVACILPAIHCAVAQDTLAPASTRYAKPSLHRRIFIGSNYRDIWAMPVRVKIFQLDKEKGGLRPTELGGGQQTKSLQMKDKQGRKWVLRTVDKTVDKAMEAQGIKSGFIRNVAQDMISAAQPYGALAVPPMAKAIGVISTGPELVFVPDDPAMGEYRDVFANTMCLLEQREPVLYPGDEVEKTDDMLQALKSGKPYRLDTRMLLQARLLDMLIGDWDRHAGQWRWGFHPKGDSVYIYPIPVDHDQAFFHSTGIIVPMVRPFTMKHLIGYRDESRKLKTLNRKEWDFDKTLLGGLSEAEWEAGIRSFQQKLTDKVLMEAVQRLPAEVYAKDGQDLYRKLQSRRNTMLKNGMKYYRFLRNHEVKEPDAIVKEEEKADKKEMK